MQLDSAIWPDHARTRADASLGCTAPRASQCSAQQLTLSWQHDQDVDQPCSLKLLGLQNVKPEDGSTRGINRHRYSLEEADKALEQPVVEALLRLCKFRNTHPAFNGQVSI